MVQSKKGRPDASTANGIEVSLNTCFSLLFVEPVARLGARVGINSSQTTKNMPRLEGGGGGDFEKKIYERIVEKCVYT